MSWLLAPLAIGYHTQIHPNTGAVVEQDGFISALQTFLVLVCVSVAVSSQCWAINTDNNTHLGGVMLEHAIIFTYGLLATIIIVILWKAKFASELHIISEPVIPREILATGRNHEAVTRTLVSWFRGKIRKVLPIIGIVLFFALGSFLDVLWCLAHITCLQDFYSCSAYVFTRYVISILFHVGRLVFMGCLMLFCSVFYDRVFVQCKFVRYGLMVILAASITTWYHAALFDSLNDEDPDNSSYTDCDFVHCNPGYNATACILTTTELYSTIGYLAPYLYPLNIEFLLLAMKTVLLLFCHCKSKDEIEEQLEEHRTLSIGFGRQITGDGRDVEGSLRSWDSASSRLRNASSRLRSVSSRLRSASSRSRCDSLGSAQNGEAALSPEIFLVNNETHINGEHLSSVSIVCFFLAILINMMLLTMGFLTFQSELSHTWFLAYQSTKIVYWFTGITMCIFGFRVSKDFKVKFHDFDALEMTVIFSLLGNSLYSFLSLASAVAVLMGTEREHGLLVAHIQYPIDTITLVVFELILGSIETFSQTIFMAYSSRIKIDIPGDQIFDASGSDVDVDHAADDNIGDNHGSDVVSDHGSVVGDHGVETEQLTPITADTASHETHHRLRDTQSRVRRQRRIFLNVLLYLMVGNFTWWIVDSFIEMKNRNLEPIQLYYYGDSWNLIARATMPLALFYRFNSFIIFAEIFLGN